MGGRESLGLGTKLNKDSPAIKDLSSSCAFIEQNGPELLIPWSPVDHDPPPPLSASVAKFTVISGREPDKVAVEDNGIPRVTAKVTGDSLVFSEDQDDLL